MIFEYNVQKQFQNQLQIDDIGNLGLICVSSEGYEYYLVLKTVMGKVAEIKFGPMLPDAELVLDGYALFFRSLPFKEPILQKEINNFINDPRKKIVDIEVKLPEEILDLLPTKNSFLSEDND